MISRSSFILLTIIFCSLFLFISCSVGDADYLTQSEKEWLRENKGKIEVLFGYVAPPNVFYNDKGEYVGFLVDMLEEIESELDYEFKYHNFETWDDLLEYSKVNRDFIVVGIARNTEREKTLRFTDPFIKNPYVIIGRKDSGFQVIEDLYGLSVCTVENYAVNAYLDELYPDLDISPVKDDLEGLRAVSNKEYDAFITNLMYVSYLVVEKGIVNLETSGDIGYLNRLAVAVSIHNPQLGLILEKTIDHISSERREALFRRWVYLDAQTFSRETVRVVFFTSSIIVLVLLLSWVWLFFLRRQVVEQTNDLKSLSDDLQTILDSIADAVVVVDCSNCIINMNPVASLLSGWTLKQAVGVPLLDVFRLVNPDPDLLMTMEQGEKYQSHCTDLNLKEGSIRQVSISKAGLPIANGGGAVIVFRDITKQKKNEKDILDARKLESLGILAGGIAHDFNNLLTGFFFSIELAKNHLPADHESIKYLDRALDSFQKTTSLTEQLLTFSKGGEPVLESLSIAPLLAETVTFSLHGSNVKFDSRVDPELWQVAADMGQLSQVLGNLTINARQAMVDGGALTLVAENIHKEGMDFVKIEMKDTGCGIPAGELDKIFDPYYTTKKQGNGLGLSSCYSIIKKHNGMISVESVESEGTVFTILLPAIKEVKKVSDKEISKKEDFLVKDCLVLIVDDELIILDVLKNMLITFGYDVITASTGLEAVCLYQKHFDQGPGIDIVITDLTIPGEIGGKESSRQILEIDPQAKIIISSGYSNDSVLANYSDYGFRGVVKKPFKMNRIKEVIQSVLQE